MTEDRTIRMADGGLNLQHLVVTHTSLKSVQNIVISRKSKTERQEAEEEDRECEGEARLRQVRGEDANMIQRMNPH
jgi:hypothetical protein